MGNLKSFLLLFMIFVLCIIMPSYIESFSRLLGSEEQELKRRIEAKQSKGIHTVPAYQMISRSKGQKLPVVFSSLDGSCGVWNATMNRYQESDYIYGDINNNCLGELEEFALKPACGWKMYSQMKYCAKLQMYNQGEVAQSSFVRGDDKGKIIIMIDGCVKCAGAAERSSNKSTVSVTFKLDYKFESFIFMKCPKLAFAEKITHQLQFNTTPSLGYDDDGFAFYGKFFSCPGLETKSEDDLPKIQLTVEHDCTPDGTYQTISVSFPGLISDQFKDFLAEMRGVIVDLDEGEIVPMDKDGDFGLYWEWDNKDFSILM